MLLREMFYRNTLFTIPSTINVKTMVYITPPHHKTGFGNTCLRFEKLYNMKTIIHRYGNCFPIYKWKKIGLSHIICTIGRVLKLSPSVTGLAGIWWVIECTFPNNGHVANKIHPVKPLFSNHSILQYNVDEYDAFKSSCNNIPKRMYSKA